MYQNNIVLEEVTFIRQAGYQPMYRRSFEMNMTDGDVNHLLNTVVNANVTPGAVISPQFLARCGTNLVSVGATPEADAPIAQGWQAERLAVVIRAVINSMGAQQVIVFEGFTDIYDLSMNSHINPDTVITLSSYTVLGRQVVNVAGQSQIREYVTETGYLANNRIYDSYTNNEIPLFKLRPTDTMVAIDANTLMAPMAKLYPNAPCTDTRLKLNTETELFNSANLNPAVYASTLLSATRDSISGANIGQQNDTVVVNVANMIQEPVATQNRFLQHLASMRNSISINQLTVAELTSMDPTCRPRVYEIGNVGLVALGDQTVAWNDLNADYHIRIATQLSNILPQLAMRCQVPAARLFATNHSVDGQWTVNLAEGARFSGADVMQYNVLLAKLRSEVFPVIEPYYGARFNVHIEYNVNTEIRMLIDLDGYGQHTLSAPIWAATLYSPMITNDFNKLARMATQMETVVSGLNQIYSSNPNGFVANGAMY